MQFKPFFHIAIFFLLILNAFAAAEPVVINGAMFPELIGTPVSSLRLINSKGISVPFQIDEVTDSGEYVCPQGECPNDKQADGKFDKQDELVFLWEDADTGAGGVGKNANDTTVQGTALMTISHGSENRRLWIVNDPAIPLSAKSYCAYDHAEQYLRTPFYYAQFCRDRFHFTRAGTMDFENGSYLDLTKELRVEIVFKLLWGLIPIRYTEKSIVCHVKRYKAGPVRLIRRGDFYLKLGLGFKGSCAIVYQMCYPQVVKVPVNVNLPVRFKSFFSDAYIEMTPVIRREVADKGFHFLVPGIGYSCDLSSGRTCIDTLIRTMPDKGYTVSNGRQGYGWIMRVEADSSLLSGSGYIVRRPSKRGGMADCGFRLTVRDLPKGNYAITNWVFFSKHPAASAGCDLLTILEPAVISTSSGTSLNLLVNKK